jgi:hypothetical protein
MTNLPLGVCGLSERHAIANFGCTRIKDLWDSEGKAWKNLQTLRMTYHTTNMNSKKIIITSISWNSATYTNHFQVRVSGNNTALAWVYNVTRVTLNTVQAVNSKGSPPLVSSELRTPK